MLYYCGLDLGKRQDFAAFAAARKTADAYDVVFDKRWPLGTDYTVIVREVARIMGSPQFRKQSCLVVDAGGVGDAVIELLEAAMAEWGRDAEEVIRSKHQLAHRRDERLEAVEEIRAWMMMNFHPVVITGGESANWSEEQGRWHVPKTDLIARAQVLLENARLRFAKTENAEVMRRELQDFREKRSPSGLTVRYEARDGEHDDLLLALTLALWFGEYVGQQAPYVYLTGEELDE